MLDQFSDDARIVMALASEEAQCLNPPFIGSEHVLIGLVKAGCGVGADVLKNLDIDLLKVRLQVEKLAVGGSKTVTTAMHSPAQVRGTLIHAIEEARNFDQSYVGTEHLLLGLLHDPDAAGAQVLTNLGLKLAEVRAEVLKRLDHPNGD